MKKLVQYILCITAAHIVTTLTGVYKSKWDKNGPSALLKTPPNTFLHIKAPR